MSKKLRYKEEIIKNDIIQYIDIPNINLGRYPFIHFYVSCPHSRHIILFQIPVVIVVSGN